MANQTLLIYLILYADPADGKRRIVLTFFCFVGDQLLAMNESVAARHSKAIAANKQLGSAVTGFNLEPKISVFISKTEVKSF